MKRISRPVATAIGVAALTFLVYGGTLSNELVWDDRELIAHQQLRSPWDLAELFGSPYWSADDYLYRPLTSWTLALNDQAHIGLGFPGEHPVGYRLVNLLLHFGVGWLLYRFSRAVGLSYWPALVVALLFAVHPIHSEAVAAIVGRAELLSALFGLCFLLLHQRRRLWPVGALFFFLALCSKESGVAFLPLALWMDLCFRGEGRRFRWGAYLTYALTLGGWLALRFAAVGSGAHGIPFLDNPLVEASTVQRLLTAAWVQFEYVRLQLFPVGLSSDYSYNQIRVVSSFANPRVLAFVLMVAGALWTAWRMRSHPVVPFALIGYAIAFALTSNFLFPIGTIMGERLAYGPSILSCMLAGFGVSRFALKQSRALAAAVALVLLLFGGLTISRNRVWSDPERFARAQVRTAPNSAKAHYSLGVTLHRNKELGGSAESLARAVAILPDYPEAWDRLGLVRAELGDLAGAVEASRRATEIYPGYTEAWFHLGLFRYQASDLEGAIRAFERAIALQPQLARAHSNLGAVYAAQGRLREAEVAWQRALELDPGDEPARNNLARLKRMTGNDRR